MPLRCKICGKVLPTRSVVEFMGHLKDEHNAEFIERVEREFFELCTKESYDLEKIGAWVGVSKNAKVND